MRRPLITVLFFAAWAATARATETENLGISVLPAQGKVTVDGKLDDWDLTAGVFVCGDVENQRDKFAVWIHAMYDARCLYVLARWIDETPMNNPGQVAGSYGFAGDCLQFRTITAAGTPQERGNHFTCWRDRDARDVIYVERGTDLKGGVIKDAKSQGAAQAFQKNADNRGYVQEIAIPWTLLTADGRPPAPGGRMVLTVEPNFTVGGEGRLTLKDIFKPGVTPDRVFTFMASSCWGIATLEPKGRLTPRPLRLADGRQLPIRMAEGLPAIDWSGLAKREERKGLKTFTFTMPADGYVSLQVLGPSSEVVCQLLNGEFRKAGRQEAAWDGLTTMNWRTPGQPVPPGTYTTRGLWHKGIGLRLKGWACNSGSAPWDSSPTSNWGGDHGVPVAVAAVRAKVEKKEAGPKWTVPFSPPAKRTDEKRDSPPAQPQVFLGWSGAEAGKALVACDMEGNVIWKNNRQGMAGAEFVAVDGDHVYAANWGPEQSNYLYRLDAATGAYAQWENGSADLALGEIFADARTRPNRIDGLAAGNGRLYLSLSSARFRREHVTEWRSVLERLRRGDDAGYHLWDKLDAGTRQRAQQWLDGKAAEDEALKAPNYYTPDVRDAAIQAMNDALNQASLVPGGGSMSPETLALSNRRRLEAAFPAQIVKLQADAVAVVDAKSRKLLHTWPVAQPGHIAAAGERLVYVVSKGTAVVALDPVSGQARTVIDGLRRATGVTVDAQGRIYVALREPDNQVKVFTPDGKPLRAIGRAGGRPLLGPWQSDGMAFAAGIAVDAAGKLWVAEADMSPKRISVWDAGNGKFVKEFFGPTTYGALGGAINPQDPGLMVGQGCEWRLDPKTGRAACVSTITRDGMQNSRFALGPNGRLYLAVAPGWMEGSETVRIFERLAGGQYKLRSAFKFQGRDQAAKTVYWADENDDGREQPGEITTVAADLRFSGWYMHLTPELTIYAGNRQLKVAGFTSCGAPKYDLAHPARMPAAGLGSADGRRVLTTGSYGEDSVWMLCYDIAAGRKLWSYPDNFVGVHGSHKACPPTVGMVRGSFGPCGVAKLPPPVGCVWVIATNVGEWHIVTEDGFYLTRLFQGDPMRIRWPAEALPGAVMDDVPPGMGGEDFGGSVCQARDGRLFVQAGKTGFWNLEVVGLDSVRTLQGSQVALSERDVKDAERLRGQLLQQAAGVKKLVVRKRTAQLTGNFDADIPDAETVTFKKQENAEVRAKASWDDRWLYLAWDVRDATPWLNAAPAPEQMYLYGDTVDFQLGADPAAEKNRGEAVRGDLRLSIGNFKSQPTAVIYRRAWDVKKPKQFSSGVIKDYRMDFVDVVGDARIKVALRPSSGYTVTAAVPLAALGLRPKDGAVFRADFGATHGGPDNQRTRLRTYWNNQETGIVDDAVFELMLAPKNWGEVEFRN